MTAAIWAISYAIRESDRAEYLDWFHGVHVPEKLARPGHAWAAHYEAQEGGRFLALFGGPDARAFLAPTPGQLKATQGALTKSMMALRQSPGMSVLCEVLGVPAARDTRPAQYARLSLYEFADPAGEDACAAWLAQERLPALDGAPGVASASMLVAALGRGRLGLLEQFATAEAIAASRAAVPAGATLVTGFPFEGRRIWPAAG